MSSSFRLHERFHRVETCIIGVLCLLVSVVLGLINLCAQNLVSEVVLLIPLLLRRRQPGADAARLGPAVKEENWSAMENVHFQMFRKNIQVHRDKRR